MRRFIFLIAFAVTASLLAVSFASACDIRTEIAGAQTALASASLKVGIKEYRYTEVRAGSKKVFKDPEREIALILLNPELCETRTVTIIKRGDRLIAPSGYGIETVRRVNGIRWNDWATDYRVTKPEGWFVVANVFPRVTSEFPKKRVIENIFYVSYAPELHLPEFVQAGQEHMLSLARRALEELRSEAVPSAALPGTLLADSPAAKPEWLARLGPIEHTDMTEFVLDPDWTIERAFIRIGLNGDQFGTYTCSKASACGLMQFTDTSHTDARTGKILPGTYTLLRRSYPAAELDPDFTHGARDQLNAMKAAYLHHDDILRRLIEAFGPSIMDDPAVLEELVAAGYNGGPTYVIRAYEAKLQKKSPDWITALPACKTTPKPGCIPRETKEYIAVKLRYLRDHWTSHLLSKADQSPD
jgi:hypothetical protein